MQITKAHMDKILGQKTHKYHARATTCRLGHHHPSLAEAKHCWCLQAQMQATPSDGPMIKELEYEKSYDLIVCGKLVGRHKPDFTYKRQVSEYTRTGQMSFVATSKWITCVDEVKGFKTKDWVFRSKIFKACYPEIEYRVIG
jgi:hypothetical protein